MRVLLVEDDAVFRRTVRRLLVTLGHEVDEADSELGVRQALTVAGYDVVLSDFDLGAGGTGRGVLALVQAAFPTVPVVLMSAQLPADLRAAAGAALDKPFGLLTLEKALKAATRNPAGS